MTKKMKALSNLDHPLHSWDVNDVCTYLRRLKLSEYQNVFRDNGVHGQMLEILSEDVLMTELGLNKLQAIFLVKCVSELCSSGGLNGALNAAKAVPSGKLLILVDLNCEANRHLMKGTHTKYQVLSLMMERTIKVHLLRIRMPMTAFTR